MRFDTSQHMKLNQQMKLAPRMIQSMEILQMPMLELQERIEQELESNIALEQIEPGMEPDRVQAEQEETRRDDTAGERELVVDDAGGTGDDFERLSSLESSYKDAFDNEYSSGSYSAARSAGERDRKMDAISSIAARQESLTEQLLHQLSHAEIAPDVKGVCELLIGYINDDGLLSETLESIVEQNQHVPGVELDLAKLEQALQELQFWLDPPGIAARDAREALLLQVDDHAFKDEAGEFAWDHVRVLIESHFDDMVQNRLPRVVQESGLTMDEVHSAMDLMKKLTLSPGRNLVDRSVPTITPDVIVEYNEDSDEYIAFLSDGFLPSLRISREYAKMSKNRALDKPAREFASTSVRSATWLIDAIRQRKATLLRVVNVVLARQRDYFDNGPQHLKPMPMIDVADQLGIHVATVSRAVAEKWLQTPRGLVPLRMFFSGGQQTDSGESMSWEAIKATLREIIDAEDKHKPFSDEALAGELKKRGIEIARRTVVKYRQQLEIPPARRRKIFD